MPVDDPLVQAVTAGHQADEPRARRLLRHEDPEVRAAAHGALARMGALAGGDLTAGLADPSAAVRARCVALATAFPGVDLVPLLDDPDAAVAEQAAWAIGEQRSPGPRRAHALVCVAVEHSDPLVREAAVAALGAIAAMTEVDVEVRATILGALATDRPAVRRRAVLALAAFEGPDVDAALANALDDVDWQVRQGAALILEAGAPGDDGP
jgi:HEAT repeat protein